MWKGSRLAKTKAQVGRKVAPTRKSVRARSKLSNSKVVGRRKKIFALKSAFVLLTAVSFAGGASWLSFSNFLGIDEIVVEGNKEISARAIQARMTASTVVPVIGLFSRQNVLSYPREELEAVLLYEFPKIESVTIDTKPTEHLAVVSVVERTDYARWCRTGTQKQECYKIDSSGFVFARTFATSTDKIVFKGGTSDALHNPLRVFIAPEYFADVVILLEELHATNLDVRILKFEGKDARLVFAGGWELRVALDKNQGAMVANLKALLNENNLREKLPELLYIDMRFDERVYYKLVE